MKKITKAIFVIIAALIGAGFASGQEINAFFYTYGVFGLLGLATCSLLLICIIYKTFKILQTEDISNYKEFVYTIVGKKDNKTYLNLGFIINTIVNIFLMVTFFIMIAGFGAYFSQELEINSYIGSGILALVCFITFMTNVNGVVKISSILVPILIFFIILIGIINVNTVDVNSSLQSLNNVNNNGWLLSSVLYCSYNSILLIPMLVPLRKYVKSKKSNVFVSLISGTIIFVLAVSIFLLLTRIQININKLEMPALYVIGKCFADFRNIYAFIILTSIYTTAISIGISLLENVAKSKKSYILIAMLICIIGFMVSGFGFSNLVALVYPAFGYLGLIQIGAIFMKKSCQRGRRKAVNRDGLK